MITSDDRNDIIQYSNNIDELADMLDPILSMTIENSQNLLPRSWAKTRTALSISKNLPEEVAPYVYETSGHGVLRLVGLIKSDISLMALAITKIMSKYE